MAYHYKKWFMKKFSFILLSLFLIGASAFAQNEAKLAQQYFVNGEYEKAASIYQKLFDTNDNNDYYFSRYMASLIKMEDFETAETAISKQIKKYPKKGALRIEYGNLLEKQFKTDLADIEFREAIKLLPANRNEITRLANSFRNLAKYDLAVETYTKGAKLLKDKTIFAYQLGDLYRRKGDVPLMIGSYLDELSVNSARMVTIQTYFTRYLVEEDFVELKKQLYDRIQNDPDQTVYPEMLTWLFIQQKDFKSAFRQVRALDRRLEENGSRVFSFAKNAFIEKDFETASTAYNYIVEEKGKTCTFYLNAKKELLNCKRTKIVEGYDYTNEELVGLEAEYEAFLDEFGKNKTTAGIIKELARLEAFYLNDLDKSIALLEEMIRYPGIHRYIQAESKLDLGDFYLMKGEIWESTLLYSQVDKEFKDDILGEEARFRNAKLSYYHGDFEWAQAQLSILKASTSELISNDAIDLSVFIMDHWGLDTIEAPMKMYAESDLLVFQNRFDEAFVKLDSISTIYPAHALEDDLFYTKSRIYKKQREYTLAQENLQKIIDNYADGIRADNALFDLAELYELHLGDKEKAKDLYGTILKEHSGSTLTVEARKRFRRLRGDDIQ